jgi:hypothetical protein
LPVPAAWNRSFLAALLVGLRHNVALSGHIGGQRIGMLKISRASSAEFIAGGGEMGALIRAHDWSSNPFGPPQLWPQSLRTALRIPAQQQPPDVHLVGARVDPVL